MFIKICGLHNIDDVAFVESLQPDFMGFVVNCPNSIRSNNKAQLEQLVVNLKIPYVFLFVNQSIETIVDICNDHKPFAVQLHGDETPEFIYSLKSKLQNVQIWKAIHLPIENNSKALSSYLSEMQKLVDSGCSLFVLDSASKNSYGGTGVACDWGLASQIISQNKTPILLAGGLKPSNVLEAIKLVQPYGVDVSSGVEVTKGKKDKVLVEAFIRSIRDLKNKLQ